MPVWDSILRQCGVHYFMGHIISTNHIVVTFTVGFVQTNLRC